LTPPAVTLLKLTPELTTSTVSGDLRPDAEDGRLATDLQRKKETLNSVTADGMVVNLFVIHKSIWNSTFRPNGISFQQHSQYLEL
jgi:hypothetical protein